MFFLAHAGLARQRDRPRAYGQGPLRMHGAQNIAVRPSSLAMFVMNARFDRRAAASPLPHLSSRSQPQHRPGMVSPSRRSEADAYAFMGDSSIEILIRAFG